MDLSDLDITEAGDDAQPLNIRDPRDPLFRRDWELARELVGDDGEPIVLYVLSSDSDTFGAYRNSLKTKARKGQTLNADDDSFEIEWSARLLMGRAWSANFSFKGAPLAWNLGNARKLMKNPLWRTQVNGFAGVAANFLPKLSSNSPSSPDISSDLPASQPAAA